MSDKTKIFSYWETSKLKPHIPPYILCCLVSMQRALGDNFLLLTPRNISQHIDFDFSSKPFLFAGHKDPVKNEISRIVAKSDFLRFEYIRTNGGIWLDADTIVLKDFFTEIMALLSAEKTLWHSEQFFGGYPNDPIISEAATNMLKSDRQVFGNPGNCKELIQAQKSRVNFIPQSIWDPTGVGEYSAKNWDLPTQVGANATNFLKNKALVKIYNSAISKTHISQQSVESFLNQGTVLSHIFLSIEPDREYWFEASRRLEEELRPSPE